MTTRATTRRYPYFTVSQSAFGQFHRRELRAEAAVNDLCSCVTTLTTTLPGPSKARSDNTLAKHVLLLHNGHLVAVDVHLGIVTLGATEFDLELKAVTG